MVKHLWKYYLVDFQKLFIDNIPIDNISEFAFRGLPDLQELVMIKCQLSLPPPIAPITKTLRNLDLERNNLTFIPVDYFNGCNVLVELLLGGNRFSVVPDVRILNATLRNFILRFNIITHIESLYFVHMIKLKTLDLTGNLLTQIEFDKVIWPAIALIALDNNCLASIKPSELRLVWRTVSITVAGNPWHCDRELCWLSRCHYKMGRREGYWFGCRGSEIIRMFGDIVCNSPDERKSVAINRSGKKSYWDEPSFTPKEPTYYLQSVIPSYKESKPYLYCLFIIFLHILIANKPYYWHRSDIDLTLSCRIDI